MLSYIGIFNMRIVKEIYKILTILSALPFSLLTKISTISQYYLCGQKHSLN